MFNPRKWFNLIMSSRQPMHTSSHRVVIRNNITIFPEVCSPCFCSVAIFQLLPFFLLCECVCVCVCVCVCDRSKERERIRVLKIECVCVHLPTCKCVYECVCLSTCMMCVCVCLSTT